MLLACTSAATVVQKRAAIRVRLSPATTVYCCGVAGGVAGCGVAGCGVVGGGVAGGWPPAGMISTWPA